MVENRARNDDNDTRRVTVTTNLFVTSLLCPRSGTVTRASYTAARTAFRSDRWGGPFPPSPRCYDARQTSLAAEAVCASVENDKAAEPVPPNRVGGRDPAHQGEPASPPTDCMRLGRLDRRCWPSRATHPGHGPPRGPGPPSFVRNHGHLSSPALNPVDPPASGHRGVAETRATKPKLDRGDHALHP